MTLCSQSSLTRLRSTCSQGTLHSVLSLSRQKATIGSKLRLRHIVLLFLVAMFLTSVRRPLCSVHASPTEVTTPIPASKTKNTDRSQAQNFVSAWTPNSGFETKIQNVIPNSRKLSPSPSSSSTSRQTSSYEYSPYRIGSHENQLPEPEECLQWRKLGRVPSKLKLYRRHFNSHDITDWFVYAAIFDEKWHERQQRRPIYLDIAANHARRWSSTWFLDRCMGWSGICVEPNPKYWEELITQRQCHLVPTCLSDRQRSVNFSYTDAYGGVVAQESSQDFTERLGVNTKLHQSKYASHFHGVKEIQCLTVDDVIDEWQHNISTGSSNTRDANIPRQRIDFMSLDVEGHELPILQGINWNHTEIDVIITENRGHAVVALLKSQGYEHFPGILKDDIWIRRDSNLVMHDTVLRWMKSFDRVNYSFKDSAGEDAITE